MGKLRIGRNFQADVDLTIPHKGDLTIVLPLDGDQRLLSVSRISRPSPPASRWKVINIVASDGEPSGPDAGSVAVRTGHVRYPYNKHKGNSERLSAWTVRKPRDKTDSTTPPTRPRTAAKATAARSGHVSHQHVHAQPRHRPSSARVMGSQCRLASLTRVYRRGIDNAVIRSRRAQGHPREPQPHLYPGQGRPGRARRLRLRKLQLCPLRRSDRGRRQQALAGKFSQSYRKTDAQG